MSTALVLVCFAVLSQPIAAGPRGDLNGNGAVDISDAIIALRAVIGLQALSPDKTTTADVTGDGLLDVRDVQLILRIAVGLAPGYLGTTEVAVCISPEAVMIPPKGSCTFQAKIAGVADQSVEWAILEGPSGGTISPAGVYIAPETPGKYHVIARSKADPTKSAESLVEVAGAPVDAPYPVRTRPPKIVILGDPSDGGRRTPFIFEGKAAQEPISQPLLRPTAVTDRTVSFAEKLEELGLDPGTVVISCEKAGFIGRVKSAAQIDGKSEVATDPVYLDEVMESASFAVVKPIRREDLESFVPLRPGVGQPVWTEKGPQGSDALKQAGGEWFSVPIEIEVVPGLTVSGTIYWRASIDIGAYWDWLNPNHRGFWFVPNFDVSFSGTVTATGPMAGVQATIPLYEMPLVVIWVQVGPVPVLFKPDVSVSLEVSASLSGGVSVRPVASLSGRFGGRYDQDGGGFRVEHSLTTNIGLSPDQPINAFLNGSARAALVPDLDILVYGVVGPYVSFEIPYFSADLTAQSSPPQVTLSGRVGISGDVGLRLSLWFWGFDFSVTGFDLGWDVFNYVYPIYPSISSLTLSPNSVTGGIGSQGQVVLSGPAPAGGAVVSLRSSGTAASVPASVTVPEGQTSAVFTVNTTSVPSDTSVTITASYRQSSADAALTIKRPVLTSLTVTPAEIIGGGTAQGTVVLSGPAPSGGVPVTLSSSNTNAAAVAASIKVPAGADRATFAVTTKQVSQDTSVTLTASCAGVTKAAPLMVRRAIVASALLLSSTSVVGGSQVDATVFVSAPAPSGGLVVAVTSSDTNAAVVPAAVTVAEGQTGATFTVSTYPVGSDTTVTITVSHGGVSKSATLVLRPQALAPQTALGQVEVGVQWLRHGDLVPFSQRFSGTPTVVVSAQRGGSALAAAAVDNSPTGFRVSITDLDGTPVSDGAWVQWLAILPPASSALVHASVALRKHGDYVTFTPELSGYPVIICSAQSGGQPMLACAVDNSPSWFRLSLIDLNGVPVTTPAWVQTVAVVIPPDKDAYWGLELQGAVLMASDMQTIGFPQRFREVPAILTSAQIGARAGAACAVDNARDGFWLTMKDHAGRPMDVAWLQWLAVRRTQ